MQPSVVGATYDLLAFSGSGNFGQFDRCFAKACAFLSLHVDESTRRKLRNIAFRHLCNTGYLDVSAMQGATLWTTVGANLVQRAQSDFVLIGSSAAAAAILAIPMDGVHHIKSTDAGLGVDDAISFFPDIIQIVTDVSEATALSHRARLSLTTSYQERLFQCLPSMHSILTKAVADEGDSPVFQPESTDRFNFTSSCWEPFDEMRPSEAGLYRRSFDYAPPSYLVAAAPQHGQLRTFRVIEREWTLVSALALLGKRLPIRYERTERRLSISKTYHQAALRLPTLLERAFRSGTLLNPSNSRQWITYDSVFADSVDRLCAQLDVFTLEER